MRIVSLNHNRQCFTFTTPVSLISAELSYWLTNKRKQTATAVPNLRSVNLFLRYRYVIQTSQGWCSDHRSKSAGYPEIDMQSVQFPGLVCGAEMNWIGVLARFVFADVVHEFGSWLLEIEEISIAILECSHSIIHFHFTDIILIRLDIIK